jgi:hypothetical protein
MCSRSSGCSYRNQTVVANAATKLVSPSAVVVEVEKVCPTDVVAKPEPPLARSGFILPICL